jgi:hypothetical protein
MSCKNRDCPSSIPTKNISPTHTPIGAMRAVLNSKYGILDRGCTGNSFQDSQDCLMYSVVFTLTVRMTKEGYLTVGPVACAART